MRTKTPPGAPNEDENLRRMLKTPPKPHAEMKVRKARTSRPKKKKVSTSASKANAS